MVTGGKNMSNQKSLNEDERLYLKFIQNNITRMNRYSFQIKGMMVTIVTALISAFVAFPIKGKGLNVSLLLVAIVPTLIFWILDSYYLQQERKFRGVYEDFTGHKEVKLYSFPLNHYAKGKYCWLKIMFSRTEWPIYMVIIIGLIIAGIIIKFGGK